MMLFRSWRSSCGFFESPRLHATICKAMHFARDDFMRSAVVICNKKRERETMTKKMTLTTSRERERWCSNSGGAIVFFHPSAAFFLSFLFDLIRFECDGARFSFFFVCFYLFISWGTRCCSCTCVLQLVTFPAEQSSSFLLSSRSLVAYIMPMSGSVDVLRRR